MDIITLSSDSEASNIEADLNIRNPSPTGLLDWNDDDDDDEARPAINYDYPSPKEKVTWQLNPAEEIEEFIAPAKTSEKIHMMNLTVKDDKETVSYEDAFKGRSLLSLSDQETFSHIKNSKSNKTKLSQKLSQEEKEKQKILKQLKKLEKEKLREEKKIEQQKQKAIKAAFFENQRNLKPEENIKFFKVHIDNNIINSAIGGNIISTLQENNIQYVVESQRKSFTVTWSKKRIHKVVDDFGELTENVEVNEENILLYLLEWEKAVELIYNNELLSHVETVRSAFLKKELTVVICGLKKYFNYKKNKRNDDIKSAVNGKKKIKPKSGERVYEEAPSISKDMLEFAIIDLQLTGKHNCRLLETSEEFSALILNFTKSLSHIDYKLERQKRQMNDLGWITSDSHQSVKIDKNGSGLLRLWQQQICQFNSVGLDTAQALVSQYNSPLALMNRYESIESSKEGELLLQNIQIRREAGILSTSRRVGPQLSKKIYKFFMSDDPDLEL